VIIYLEHLKAVEDDIQMMHVVDRLYRELCQNLLHASRVCCETHKTPTTH